MNASSGRGIVRIRFVLHSSICISEVLCNIARDFVRTVADITID